MAAGTEASKDGGEDLVRYQIFLDIIRISRNRKMAALQRAKELTRKGLKRWQQNSLVRAMPNRNSCRFVMMFCTKNCSLIELVLQHCVYDRSYLRQNTTGAYSDELADIRYVEEEEAC